MPFSMNAEKRGLYDYSLLQATQRYHLNKGDDMYTLLLILARHLVQNRTNQAMPLPPKGFMLTIDSMILIAVADVIITLI